jgi:hypothetical protein
MTGRRERIRTALKDFVHSVSEKLNLSASGAPEDQLRGALETLFGAVGSVIGVKLLMAGEVGVADVGRPDFALSVDNVLSGHLELKQPGKGADPESFRGHDRRQWQKFQRLPNLLYTDGNEWRLFRSGEVYGEAVRLSVDVREKGKLDPTAADAEAFERIFRRFVTWHPIVPDSAAGLAELVAPLCRVLRDEVEGALDRGNLKLVELADEWRGLLFPDADNTQVADAYAQTVTFALLLARFSGAKVATAADAIAALKSEHAVLSRALHLLTDESVKPDIRFALDVLLRVIGAVDPGELKDDSKADPWLQFYEPFLAKYDPALRKDVGAYYTPPEVVRCQTRLVDELLRGKLGKSMGFAEQGVITLDPAVGTGTYLLGIIEHSLSQVHAAQGPGAVAGAATQLAENLHGFERLVGPYSVAELRVSQDILRVEGATLPDSGLNIFLTDTLESPKAKDPQSSIILKPIAEQHRRALAVKDRQPVLVCIGNPPYDRHEAAGERTEQGRAKAGGWVRFGDEGREGRKRAILNQFIEPVTQAGKGVYLKNLYNLYVYFWRWALWKVFEHEETASGAGIVSFISASSYLDGEAFLGMREHMRRLCDDIWIIDLGGEGRGARTEENIFDIQTPVAIAVCARYSKVDLETPAKVRYARIRGSRSAKLAELDKVKSFRSLKWKECASDWQASFRPARNGTYFKWPLLKDLMPWQHSGSQFKRNWPVAPIESTLKLRWAVMLEQDDRRIYFRESRDRKVNLRYEPMFAGDESKRVSELAEGSACPRVVRYSFRTLDRQYAIVDARVGDFLRPDLWRTLGPKQCFLTASFSYPPGHGPALTACPSVPDLHHFSGRGGKDVVPLYRDAGGNEPNILPGLLELLGKNVSAEDFLAYVYAMLAHPGFTRHFYKELESRTLRVPLTKDRKLFRRAVKLGQKLLWLHTYGERFHGETRPKDKVQPGKARCLRAVPTGASAYPESFEFNATDKTLHVGDGVFGPVASQVWEFEVSGLKVVQSWLGYRMKNPKGKKSSPLDDIVPERWTAQLTNELLELLWVLEATLELYGKQAVLLDEVLESPLLSSNELPAVPDELRMAPKTKAKGAAAKQLDFGSADDE